METPVRRRCGHLAAAGLCVLLLGAAASACSSGPPPRPVASLPGHGGASATAPTLTESQSDQSFVAFAWCLRAHGLDEPDPRQRPGHTGLSVQIPPSSPANRPALTACDHLIAKDMAAKEAGARTELARWLPSLVRYATCMRSHDVAMLDPGPDGQLNLGNVPGMTSDIGRYSPQFRAADRACRHLLPPGVHDDGTGP